jgi:hypothetical protein
VARELGVRQAVVESQRDRLPLPRVEAAQAAPERRRIARLLEPGEGARVAAFQLVQEILVRRFRIGLPQPVEAAVAHDARHPGHRRGPGCVVLAGVPPHADIAFLQHFLGPVLTPQYTQRDREQFRRARLVELVEGGAVAERAARDQRL